MIRTLLALEHSFDVLVVDDGSPDGTAAIVKQILTIFTADDDVTHTSVKVFRLAVVFMYETTVWSGYFAFSCKSNSGFTCSAIGQPASAFDRMTRFCGERIFTVSAINLTPHISTVSASDLAACWLNPNESPT